MLLWAILLVLVGIAFPLAWIIIVPVLVILLLKGFFKTLLSPIGNYSQRYSKQRTFLQKFKVTQEEAFNLSLKIISELGYRIENIDKHSGLIMFKTGMSINVLSGQKGSIIIIPAEDDICSVQVNISYEGQLWDWGEGEKIADKILDGLSKVLTIVEEENDGDDGNNKDTSEGLFKTWWNANK